MKGFLFGFLWSLLLLAVATELFQETLFYLDKMCPDYCNLSKESHSFVECAAICNTDEGCVFSAWDSNLGLCTLCESSVEGQCNTMELSVGYRKMTCQNGGTLDTSRWRCSCPVGFAGDLCQRLIYDCTEGLQLNYPSGVYKIQPPLATSPFSAHCKMIYGGRTLMAVRNNAALFFNRTWEEYRNGFGSTAGDHWLGLEHIYLLTNSGLSYMLNVELWKKDGKAFQQKYYNFSISDEASGYRLYFTSSSPNSDPAKALGDSLSCALGSRFSTFDSDNDGDDNENCALRHQSGWWFPSPCNLTEGNPLGRLVRPDNEVWSGKPEDVFWQNDLGNIVPSKIRMWFIKY